MTRVSPVYPAIQWRIILKGTPPDNQDTTTVSTSTSVTTTTPTTNTATPTTTAPTTTAPTTTTPTVPPTTEDDDGGAVSLQVSLLLITLVTIFNLIK